MSPEAEIQDEPALVVLPIDLSSQTPVNESFATDPSMATGSEDSLNLKVGDAVRTGVLYVEAVERTEMIRGTMHYVLTSYDLQGKRERSVTKKALLKMGATKE